MFSWLLSLIRSLFNKLMRWLGLRGEVRSEITLRVHIKTTSGQSFLIELNPKWNIAQVKRHIAPKMELKPESISIIFAGKELADNLMLEECDLGQQSFLHAVKLKVVSNQESKNTGNFIQNNPMCQTLLDLQLTEEEKKVLRESEVCTSSAYSQKKAHFFVYCDFCASLQSGKLRVRCSECKAGAFTVDRDPCCWEDVLLPHRVSGTCFVEVCDNAWAEFYFKCANHPSRGENDAVIPLELIKSNFKQVQCLACLDVSDPVLVFPCSNGHVICIDCFQQYCQSRLNERSFVNIHHIGYTLSCPAGCENSAIEGIHHFRLMGPDQFSRYLHFAAEEHVIATGGLLCPQPGCGMGLLPEPGDPCRRVQCISGCEFVFCRDCLQGYHIGECLAGANGDQQFNSILTTNYIVDAERASQARWDAQSRVTIRVTSKPCPKCRTPTERDGGCMHMICTRSGCGFHWCWVCQTEWTRQCMGSHWFG